MAAPRAAKPAGFNTKSPTIKRILQESKELASSPDPTLSAAPLETNLFEWHFTITGPPSTPYADGIYHGRIVLPPAYPLRPPAFRFLTPSGRFEVNREICLSISGHHEETWQPAWGIRTALCAIRAFMSGDAKGQVGGLDMGAASRERLAKESRAWRCAGCGGRTNEEIIKEVEQEWRENHEEGAEHRDDDVPEELRLAFRDDLEKAAEEDKASGSTQEQKGGPAPAPVGGESGESEQATPVVAAHTSISPSRAATSSQASPETPRARVTAETLAVTPLPRRSPRQGVTVTAASGRNGATPQDMPAWIDKAILGLVVMLVILVLKRFAATEDY
jgi:ubiquitin-conjugating enzyme E2 J1